jgi:hypothetical protein
MELGPSRETTNCAVNQERPIISSKYIRIKIWKYFSVTSHLNIGAEPTPKMSCISDAGHVQHNICIFYSHDELSYEDIYI